MAAPTGAARVDALLIQLERDILQDIARRVAKAGKITSTADYQAYRITLLGNGSKDVRNLIQAATGRTAAEMASLYAVAAQEAHTHCRGLYTATGVPYTPYSANKELQQLVASISTQTGGTFQNMARTTGFMIRGPSGRLEFTEMSKLYGNYLDRRLMAVATGVTDYRTAVKQIAKDLTDSGVRTVDYSSGRSLRINAAALMAVRTGMGQIAANIAEADAKQLGTDLFEVSWHHDARPDHQSWQGRVYTLRQLRTVCGYGTVTGLCGANCRHTFYPYIRGISHRQWSDKQLAARDSRENKPKTFQGKDYTDYEATQEQRRMETVLRAAYEQASMFETAGDDMEDDLTIVKARIQSLRARYRALCKAFGMSEQYWRISAA